MTARPAAETHRTPRLHPFYRLIRLAEIDSTSEEAKRRAEAGAPEGTLVWADRQTTGHGRRARPWHSPAGNLYCSILLRPDCPPGRAAQLSYAGALAVGGAIEELLPSGVSLHYKWPNDVLIEGCKAAGVLLESATSAAGGSVAWLVVGIGINVISHPDHVSYPATHLAAHRAGADLGTLLESVSEKFLVWHEEWRRGGFAEIRERWLERAAGLDTAIEVSLDSGLLTGRFATIDDDGALVLIAPDGAQLRVPAGDVYFPSARAKG